MTDIKKLITGLKILEKYKPDARFFSSSSILMTQEVEFKEINEEDKKKLEEYGWQQGGDPFSWKL